MVCFKEVIRDEGFLVGACRRMCGIGVVRARTNRKVGADLRTVYCRSILSSSISVGTTMTSDTSPEEEMIKRLFFLFRFRMSEASEFFVHTIFQSCSVAHIFS